MSEFREEISWLLHHPVDATRWWFHHIVVARLNGEHAAAKRYDEMIKMSREQIAESRRRAQEGGVPRRKVIIDKIMAEDTELLHRLEDE